VRVALVQLTSTDDLDANLERARTGVADAARRGAEFVALPENFAYLRREGSEFPCAQPLDGEIVRELGTWAREHGIWLLGGSVPEAISGSSRIYNTSVLISPSGALVASYRKIHLFDVELGDRGGSFRESERFAPGQDVVVAPLPCGPLGMSICYDLRFPELYRKMAEQGVVVITVPSAFAPATGKDHWEVLLRARAIENQAFVLAPAQCGRHSADRSSHGRSLIVDPWGIVLAQAGDRPTTIVADLDFTELEAVRKRVPALSHRRL
jgi:predicted amidohydrolase